MESSDLTCLPGERCGKTSAVLGAKVSPQRREPLSLASSVSRIIRLAGSALLTLILFTASDLVFAKEREIAAKGKQVRLTVAKNYKCGKEAEIFVRTRSAAYFDKGAKTINKLAKVARAVMAFECPKIKKFVLTGITDGIVVFKAEAEKKKKWKIASFPAPLEGAALLYSLNPPNFHDLARALQHLDAYRAVSGIEKSYQYFVYDLQLKRLATVANGDAEQFAAYMKAPGRDLGTFEQALAHYQTILQGIKVYAPEHYPKYSDLYASVAASMKDDYWAVRVNNALGDEEGRDIPTTIERAIALLGTEPDPEFRDYVDQVVVGWIEGEILYEAEDLEFAALSSLGAAADFIADLPSSETAPGLPKTKAKLTDAPSTLYPQVEARLGALLELAEEAVTLSGNGYSEIETVFETGYGLAEEFEQAGFVDEGAALLSFTAAHIAEQLEAGLETFRDELAVMEFSVETAAELELQAAAFEELTDDFPAFSSYSKLLEDALKRNRSAICTSILTDASATEADRLRSLQVRDGKVSLQDFACAIYANGHLVETFEADGQSRFRLSIKQADGEQRQFDFDRKETGAGGLLVPSSQERKAAEPEWGAYAAKLIESRPSGKPNAQGIRECDRLSADPQDPGRLTQGVVLNFEEPPSDDRIDRAIDACIAAVEHDPSDVRQHFQLARMLNFVGDEENAREHFEVAANGDYPAALFFRAEAVMASSEDQNSFVDALELYKAASDAGYKPATTMLAELNPDGAEFYREIPPPTPKQILRTLRHRNVRTNTLGLTGSISVVNVNVKECFQLNASDFSCEFRKVIRCKFGGSSDPVFRWMSNMLKSSCRSSPYEFGTFRKLGDDAGWARIKDAF